MPNVVPFSSSMDLYFESLPVMIAQRSGDEMYRPTSLYAVCPFARPAIRASVSAVSSANGFRHTS